MDGILCVDKPAGITSHDVVARVRHILNHQRVGHSGTLDPFATGLLVLLVGRATRLTQFLTRLEKEYEAVIRLGYATDTGDITGKPLSEPATGDVTALWSREQIQNAMTTLTGEIDQRPPMYSAKKKAGRKLYEYARKGEEVEREPVRVSIFEFEPMRPEQDWLKDNLDGTFDFEVRVVCSAGTYVRTLAEDFGRKLQIGAHLAELRRTRVGDFSIDQAKTLDQLKTSAAEESVGKTLYKPDEALKRLPAIDVDDEDVRKVCHGINLQVSESSWSTGEQIRILDKHKDLIAVGVFDTTTGTVHPAVVLATDNS